MINASNINTNTQYTVQRPKINRRYSALKYGYSQQGTNNVGTTFPFFIRELSPSDKASFQTNINMQFSPFVSQLFARMTNEISGYKLPYRVLCEKLNKEFSYLNFDWENFSTGGQDGQDSQLLPSIYNFPLFLFHSFLGLPIDSLSGSSPDLSLTSLYDSDIFECYYDAQNVAYFYKKDAGRFPLSVNSLSGDPTIPDATFTGTIYLPRVAVKLDKVDMKIYLFVANFRHLESLHSNQSIIDYLTNGVVTPEFSSESLDFDNYKSLQSSFSELFSNVLMNTLWDSFGLPMPEFDGLESHGNLGVSQEWHFEASSSSDGVNYDLILNFPPSVFKFFMSYELSYSSSSVFNQTDDWDCLEVGVNAMPFVLYNLIYNDVLRFPDLEKERSLLNIFPFRGHEQNNYFTRARIFQQRGVSPMVPVSVDMRVQDGNNSDIISGSFTLTSPTSVSVEENRLNFGTDSVYFGDSSFQIDDMLQGLILMRYQVNNAKMRSRYIDHLRYRFGVVGLDARLQLPEYLGSYYQDVYQNNVVQTAPAYATGSTGLGTITSIASVTGNSGVFTTEAKEHEIVMFLSVCRPDMVIEQGIPKWLAKKNRFDFVIPELVDSPDVPIKKHELIGSAFFRSGRGAAACHETFGWTSIYDEYRTSLNQVVGRLRPSDRLGLRSFTLARRYDKDVELNGSFVQIPNVMNRVKQYVDEPDFIYSASVTASTAQPLPIESEPGQFVGL